MSHNLDGKTALVTGSARGIGNAVAKALAARGAHILAHQRGPGDSPLVAEIVAAGGKASVVTGELATLDGIAELGKTTAGTLGGGKLDILVHNAGIAGNSNLETANAEQFEHEFAVNVRAPLLLTQALNPHLADGGRVVVVTSAVARVAFPNLLTYSTTKGAVNVLIRNLAAELAPRNITVNGVAPGVIDTDMSSFARSDEGKAFVLGFQALKRIGKPDDIADVIAFLASDASRWITGQVIEASGGSQL